MKTSVAYAPKISCFRQWSRKKYAVFLSLSRVVKIGVLCFSYSLVNRLPLIMAQTDTTTFEPESLEIEAVEVIGRRGPAVFSEVSRTISVISREDIEKAGVQNIIDLLEYVSNVDIRQRGIYGIQADASIRGGSFDHVMILMNGINLSDPQTGHLSLDIPIDHENVERIEILEGPAARVLGPGAFTGALNIVTKRGTRNALSASQVLGKYGYNRTQLDGSVKAGIVQNYFSLSRSSSEGYMKNTDHHLQNVYYRGNLIHEEASIDFQAGYQHKKFGAGGFYSPRFPDQFEEASVWLASLKVSTGKIIKITPSVYWRRRKDHFLLVRDNPEFYENFHRTDVYGSQLNISFARKNFTSVIGFDLRSENILSNNIGFDHPEPVAVKGEDSAYYTRRYARTNMAAFQESSISYGKFRLTAGIMVNWNTAYPDEPSLFPGIDMSYQILPGTHVYASVNRALHLPTFSDLFYTDPVNQGNINLNPNRMTSFEGGLKYARSKLYGNFAGFYQSGKEMIDWLWSYSSNRYAPVNLDQYNAWGITSNFTMDLSDYPFFNKWISSLSANYLYLHIDKSIPDSVSKYYNLKNKLSVTIRQNITKSLFFSWNLSYQDRYGEVVGYNTSENAYYTDPYEPFWLVDGSVTWSFRFLQAFLEISNILNTRYIDAGSAFQPGRWPKAGLILRW